MPSTSQYKVNIKTVVSQKCASDSVKKNTIAKEVNFNVIALQQKQNKFSYEYGCGSVNPITASQSEPKIIEVHVVCELVQPTMSINSFVLCIDGRPLLIADAILHKKENLCDKSDECDEEIKTYITITSIK